MGTFKEPGEDAATFNASAPTSVTVSTASVQLAAANSDRGFLAVKNLDAAETVSIGLDGNAAVDNNGIVLAAGEAYTFDGDAVPTGQVNAIATGSCSVAVQEGNR